MSLSLKLCQFISFKQKWILMKPFVESQFEVLSVNEFETKANFYEDISWASVCSCVSLWVSNKSQFLWRHILGLSLKLHNSISFEPKPVLMKTFLESQFEVIYFYDFQTRANSDEDICWVLVWSYLSWQVSNKTEFLWRHLLSLSLKLYKFMSF